MIVQEESANLTAQKLSGVAVAELRRATRRGGMRVAIALGIVVAALCGVGTAALVRSFAADSEGTTLLITLPVEVAAVVAGLWFSLAHVMYFGRDARSGMLATSLLLVPNRGRLFKARLVAAATLSSCATLTALSVAAIAALLINPSVPGELGSAVLGIVVGTLSVALFAVFGYFFATAVPRTALAPVLFMAVIIVLPLAVAVAQFIAPPAIGQVMGAVSGVLPSALLVKAVSVSTVAALGPGPVLLNLLGLALWCAAAGCAAAVTFNRYDC